MSTLTTRGIAARLYASAGGLLPLRMTALRLSAPDKTPRPDRFADYGQGSWLVPPAGVNRPELVSVGTEVVVLEGAHLVVQPDAGHNGYSPLIVIGNRVRLGRFAHVLCTLGVTIGDTVSGSDEVAIVDSWQMPGPTVPATLPAPAGGPVAIGRGAYLGARCIIGPGVTVGAGAFVGEGAVVLDDVPPHALVYGNPARIVREWSEGSREWKGSVTP